MTTIERMKVLLRENDVEFFSDAELQFYLAENGNDVNAAVYQCLIIKSEDTSVSLSGLTTADTSNYFKRIAQRYKPNNSRILGGD